MGTKTVRLDEAVYERIKEKKREDETVSEAIARLTDTPSLIELGNVVSETKAEQMEQAIEDADETDVQETSAVLDRFDDS